MATFSSTWVAWSKRIQARKNRRHREGRKKAQRISPAAPLGSCRRSIMRECLKSSADCRTDRAMFTKNQAKTRTRVSVHRAWFLTSPGKERIYLLHCTPTRIIVKERKTGEADSLRLSDSQTVQPSIESAGLKSNSECNGKPTGLDQCLFHLLSELPGPTRCWTRVTIVSLGVIIYGQPYCIQLGRHGGT
jgi:hypothetical protein